MSEFVILFHRTPESSERPDHWDLMIQEGDHLMTWALEVVPQPGCLIPAVRLADHRLAYLEYQGVLSDGRGEVTRWARGKAFHLVEEGAGQVFQLSGSEFNWRVRIRAREGSRVLVAIESSAEGQSPELGKPV
ncbi:MAG: hypothetical protein VYE64_09765 [Planctomycetota bacterium]|nr:hypothetical protein [Planctomycetota bacterium]